MEEIVECITGQDEQYPYQFFSIEEGGVSEDRILCMMCGSKYIGDEKYIEITDGSTFQEICKDCFMINAKKIKQLLHDHYDKVLRNWDQLAEDINI
jgi:hypothetical protein